MPEDLTKKNAAPAGRGYDPHLDILQPGRTPSVGTSWSKECGPPITGGENHHPSLSVAERQAPPGGFSGDLLWYWTTWWSEIVLMVDFEGHDEWAVDLAEKTRRTLPTLDPFVSLENPLLRLNDLLLRQAGWEERSASAILIVIEPYAQRMTVLNAGHPRLILIRRGEVEWIEGGGPLLGVVPDVYYIPTVLPFDPGDAAVFFTDGLLDVKSPIGIRFDEDRVFALVQQHCHLPPEDLVQEILREVYRFGDLTDDLSLCAIGHRAL